MTSEETKKIYRTSGHGESTVSTSLSELFEKANLSMEELNLLMNSEIPEDCDLLFMYAPTTDITEDEKNTLSEYLKNGGKMMLISGAEDQETPNLDTFMEEYGLQMADGILQIRSVRTRESIFILPGNQCFWRTWGRNVKQYGAAFECTWNG